MTPEMWLDLQEQLWSAFGPLIQWWLAFVLVGLLGAVVFVYISVYFAEWTSG